jgi:hypothetical protein
MSTRAEIYESRKLFGITKDDLQRFKDGIHVGDVVTMGEASVEDIGRCVHFKYTVTAKHKHVFTVKRNNRRGHEIVVSVAYQKYMTEGENTIVRTYPR